MTRYLKVGDKIVALDCPEESSGFAEYLMAKAIILVLFIGIIFIVN